MKNQSPRLKNRDLSWLSFNHRVLQEAADPRVPVFERIKFLAIFSSNLDEFFRVRVSSLRALMSLKKKSRRKLDIHPGRLLRQIRKTVEEQQEEFGRIFRQQIVKELARHNLHLVDENRLTPAQRETVRTFATSAVLKHLFPFFLDENKEPPFLNNRSIYLAVELLRNPLATEVKSAPSRETTQIALVEIPTPPLPRFYLFPGGERRFTVMFLDDVIRVALPLLFPNHVIRGTYAIKLTRDAELDLGDEYSDNLIEKIKRAVAKRRTGLPSRFLYDLQMPPNLLRFLVARFGLQKEDLVRGGRYHNFSDFHHFPNPLGPGYENLPLPLLAHPGFQSSSIFSAVEKEEYLLFFPYHSYDPVIRLMEEAAGDHSVTSVFITLYRVADNSRIVQELLRAARNGKSVTAVVELKARFDEESNVRWAEELEQAGVRVQYRFPGLKIHAKLCLITRTTREKTVRIAYLSTGNFNEDTAALYSDFGFFTSNEKITAEVARVFNILLHKDSKPKFKHLLVAPFTMRKKFVRLIRHEIKNARDGRKASIIIKVNSLEDPEMIEELYRASRAGVEVSLIVRGICCLITEVPGTSRTIRAVSIVDRFLEHARVFLFHNGGKELCYLSSADWMTRNLSGRIEVAFPIHSRKLADQIRSIVRIQLNDTVKGRLINRSQDNTVRNRSTGKPLQSQIAAYHFLKNGMSTGEVGPLEHEPHAKIDTCELP